MERQVPTGISNIFEQIAQKHREDRQREQAIKESYPLAGALYKKAKNIIDEFGINEDIVDNGKRGKIVLYRETPPVPLVHGNEKLELIVREGYQDQHNKYRSMQIHQRREGGGFTTTPLFEIHLFGLDDNKGTLPIPKELTDGSSGRLETPLEEFAGSEAMQAVSELLDLMQQSLSETYTPRSQQIRPEEPRKGLRDLFRRLKPTLGKT